MVIENDSAFGHWLGYVGCVTEYCLYTVGLCIEYFVYLEFCTHRQIYFINRIIHEMQQVLQRMNLPSKIILHMYLHDGNSIQSISELTSMDHFL